MLKPVDYTATLEQSAKVAVKCSALADPYPNLQVLQDHPTNVCTLLSHFY